MNQKRNNLIKMKRKRISFTKRKIVKRILHICTALIFLAYIGLQSRTSLIRFSTQYEVLKPITVTETRRLVYVDWSWTPSILSSSLPPLNQDNGMVSPDFGMLHNMTRAHKRTIHRNDEKQQHIQRDAFLSAIDKEVASYYDPYEDRDFHSYECRPPKWKYDMYPVCNIIHELSLERLPENQEYSVEYLASGLYRDVYSFRGHAQQFALKKLRLTDMFRFDIVSTWYIRGEAMLLEKLSASPRLANLYGYCSFTTLTQFGVGFGDTVVPVPNWKFRSIEPRPPIPSLPNNQLQPHEKLKLAIQMAEGMAELHGFHQGVICHSDVSLHQWLLNENNEAFLNDVNNLWILNWNDDQKNYCPFFAFVSSGDFRPAEAYLPNRTSLESDDVWSFGNILFSLLTGIEPWIEKLNDGEAREAILRGDVPVIPSMNRSLDRTERHLMEIIGLCHQSRPEDRATIFTVLQRLRDAGQEYEHENLLSK